MLLVELAGFQANVEQLAFHGLFLLKIKCMMHQEAAAIFVKI